MQTERAAPVASAELKAELIARLRRIEGQARGVQRMIEEDRDCPDVLQQMAAIRSAVHQASLLLARAYLTRTVSEAGQDGGENACRRSAEETIDRLMATLAKLE